MSASSARALCRVMLLAAVLLPLASLAQPALAPEQIQPASGDLAAREPLIDPVFGIASRALGLRRRVEMWQWAIDEGATTRYQARWSEAAIDSSRFDANHRNPKMPFTSAQWFSDSALLNGRAVSPGLLATLGGWQAQDVQFDLLPENLAAIFRAENGSLVSSDDLSQPQIGDLRVSWQVLPAGPVHGYAAIDDAGLGVGEGAALVRGIATDADLPGLEQGARAGSDLLWWLLAALLVGLVLLGLLLRRTRR